MQKQLKALDRQLKNSGLVRIPDITQKQEKSLFRALSMAVFYSHHYFQDIATEIRLTLISNLAEKRNNPFPIVHQNAVLKKYMAEAELILDFWGNPDLNCFHNDVLVIASAAFSKTICIYSLDKDEYLNEVYISACKNPHEERLCIAKAGKKYYAVLKHSTQEIIPFLRETIIDAIINSMFEQDKTQIREDRIHYPHYDEVVTSRHARQHKKSLSDCGDLPLQIQAFEQRKKEFQESSDRGDRGSYPPTAKSFDRFQEQFFDSSTTYTPPQVYSMQNPFNQQTLPAYYNYNYPQYAYPQQDATFPYMESPAPVNNQRYTGRLKFFDQNGNYGFIVIDNLNIDLFVHFDDLSKAGLNKQKLLSIKNNYQLRFYFTYYEYEGKQHKKSKKAVDLQLIQE